MPHVDRPAPPSHEFAKTLLLDGAEVAVGPKTLHHDQQPRVTVWQLSRQRVKGFSRRSAL